MALPVAVPIIGGLLVLGGTALRLRKLANDKKPATAVAALNNPTLRAPPAPTAAERIPQQEALVKEVLAQPIPARVFKIGELIGVDIFASGMEFAGFPKGILNFTVTNADVPTDPKLIQGVVSDSRFRAEPLFNPDGSIFGIPIIRAAVAPSPDPAGFLTLGAPSPAPAGPGQVRLNPVPTRTLRAGTSGTDVSTWQQFLNAVGFDVGAADGIFGAKTTAGTIAFQASKGLTADGIAGPNTFKAAAP